MQLELRFVSDERVHLWRDGKLVLRGSAEHVQALARVRANLARKEAEEYERVSQEISERLQTAADMRMVADRMRGGATA